MKKLKNIPVIGPLGAQAATLIRTASRQLRGKRHANYAFKRLDAVPASLSGVKGDVLPVLNLVNYTKTSESTYNGQDFPAGYHTLDLPGLKLPGQRHPRERFDKVPFDFTGKTALDIGCNQGGMLYGVADKIAHGVGIDYDHRLINAANRIKSYASVRNLDFYVFNLEGEDLNLIRDFIPGGRVDIVFLLSVCMWIRNWREVINLAHSVSGNLLFESNGKAAVQDEQVDYLKTLYKSVQLLSGASADDSLQKSRRLYLCTN